MRSIYLSSIALLSVACSFDAPVANGTGVGGDTSGSQAGSGTTSPGGGNGATSTAGSGTVSGMAGTGTAAGSGNVTPPGTGGTDTGTGGAPPVGGSGTGGTPPAGGSSSGGTPAGGSGGGSGEDLTAVTKALDGLHLDDACGNISSDTCIHVQTNPYELFKEVTIGGTTGTTYDVTLRFRGVVEPSNIGGGTQPAGFTDTTTISGQMWRTKPFTIGGTVADATYEPWYLSVSSPAQTFYLNDQKKVAHISFKIDYEYTIQMAAGAKIKLDWKDGNDHEIINKNKDSFPELADNGTSKNQGQFMNVTVTSVKVHQ